MSMDRVGILDTAKAYVTKDRAATHGDAEDNFTAIAGLWNEYAASRQIQATFTATDVAVMMVLFKCARLAGNPGHADNWVDIAGYAACGGEIALRREMLAGR